MKKILALAAAAALTLSLTPAAFAEDAPVTAPVTDTAPAGDAAVTAAVDTSLAPAAAEAKKPAEETPEEAALKAKRAEFLSVYGTYVNYYNNVYVPKYNEYNAALDALAARIQTAKDLTVEQLQAIKAFLADIRAQKSNFYGTRTTPGKSRYVVPHLRDSMTAANNSQQYDEAISLCAQLSAAVKARVDFLSPLIAQINGYVIPTPPTTSDGAVAFHAKTYANTSYYDFTITISNNTDKAISGWELNFTYDGDISTVWANGSAIVLKQNNGSNGKKTMYPSDKWQSVYTIPAHGSVTIIGNGNKIGTKVSSGSIFGQDVDVTFGVN